MSIELHKGDLARFSADILVNAANSALIPGGGVCGALHRGGGPEIERECTKHIDKHGSLDPGNAVLTTAGQLDAEYVCHAVGPVWEDKGTEAKVLRQAYKSCLDRAAEVGAESIAFPAISTGIFGYPVKEAAEVALSAVKDAEPDVHFILYTNEIYNVFRKAL